MPATYEHIKIIVVIHIAPSNNHFLFWKQASSPRLQTLNTAHGGLSRRYDAILFMLKLHFCHVRAFRQLVLVNYATLCL